jgi:hypothetical protein
VGMSLNTEFSINGLVVSKSTIPTHAFLAQPRHRNTQDHVPPAITSIPPTQPSPFRTHSPKGLAALHSEQGDDT